MRVRTGWLVLGLSLAAGAVATLLVASWLSAQRQSPNTALVVAARDIAPGQILDPASLETVPWPRDALPPGAQMDSSALAGRVLRTGLVRGEPILAAKLAPEGAKGGLSAVIAPGRRAITVRVNEVMGVAGFALPGNHVDILVSAQESGDAGQMVSRMVLERILVLAVAQESGRDETRPRVVSAVTLEVTPDQAERLDLARNIGQLSLVLRNHADTAAVTSRGVSRHELLGAAEKRGSKVSDQAPAAPASRALSSPASSREDPPLQVEVIRGVLKSSAAFSSHRDITQ